MASTDIAGGEGARGSDPAAVIDALAARLADRERVIADIEDVAGIGIREWDMVNDAIYWSVRQRRLHGLPDDAAPADFQAFLEHVHPDDRARVVREVAELRRTGRPFTFRYRISLPDGAARWLMGHGRMLTDAAGRPTRMVGTSQDLTELHAAQEALRQTGESYRTIFELASEALYVHDPVTGQVLDANRAACELHGVTLEQLRGGGIAQVSHGEPPYTGEHALALVRRAAAGESLRFEWLGRHTSGSPVWLEVSLNRATILGEDRVLASVRNITERKAAETELQRAYLEMERRVRERTEQLAAANRALEKEIEEHRAARHELIYRAKELEALFQALPDVYLRLQADGLVTDFRRGSDAERYPIPDGFPDHIVGTRIHEFMPTELRPMLLETLERVRRTQRVATIEYALMVGGERREFENRIAPCPDDTLICVIRDITRRKLTEASLALAKEEAERAREAAELANRVKSEFLSRMSHELRTPMNSILGFAQVLERTDLPAASAKSVQHILRAGRHLLQLINEVLEIARIEAGRHNLSLEPVRIGTVLREAVTMVRPLATQRAVRLEEPPPNDCDRFVHADRQRLAQVVLNLLSNAIKYNVEGGSVRIACGAAPGAPERIVVRVEDTGPGIPEDGIDQLFTPFARLGAERSEVEGTGLGLALSQRLTEAMGGWLRLDRTGPTGSVFALELRRAADPVLDIDKIAAARRVETTGAGHASATILYIEDNLANLSLVETILLGRPRWRTLPALQGQLGLELARQHVPDLILLDLHLPDMPGDEVLRRLRADERTAAIPIVMISADATHTTIDRLLGAGAAAFLTKPIDIDEFLGTLEALMPKERP